MNYMQHLSESEDFCDIADAAYQLYSANCKPKNKDKVIKAITEYVTNEGKIANVLRNQISKTKSKNQPFKAGMYAHDFSVKKGSVGETRAMVAEFFSKIAHAVDRSNKDTLFVNQKIGHIKMPKIYMDMVKHRLPLAEAVVASIEAIIKK